MPKTKPKKTRSKEDVLQEWFSWINATNATLLSKAFESWINEQGYYIAKIPQR